MKFKVGQVWKDGSGDLHTISNLFSTSHYPVVAKAHNGGSERTYTQQGRYIDDDKPCGLDLVELVLDVDETEQAEQKPGIRVGQVWRTLDGSVAKVIAVNPSSTTPIVAEIDGSLRLTIGPDLVDLLESPATEPERDEIVHEQAEASGKMLDEYGDRALFDALVVQSVVTGMIERQGVEKVLAGVRMIIEARRSL